MTAIHDQAYVIPTGPLNSVASLIYFVARPLRELSLRYSKGAAYTPVFDLSSVEPRHQSMAALTAFLAIAERLSRYVGQPIPIKIQWNPAVLGFWSDIGFLSIARENEILDLPKELIGGYEIGATNPNTMIVRYESDPADPQPDVSNGSELRDWKDRNRSLYENRLSLLCEYIFNPERSRVQIGPYIKNLVTANAAELTLNSLMHGQAPAFVGIQRSPRALTVAVCDCGEGFPKSLSRHPLYGHAVLRNAPSHIQGLLLGSLMNKKEMGLRRAITDITESRELEAGWVSMSSYAAELQWRYGLWRRALDAFNESVTDPVRLDVSSLLGQATTGSATQTTREHGHWRNWDPGLRGTRIAFELRLRHDGNR